MYYEDAVNRINSINWEQLGKAENGNNTYLGYEYLRRIAFFFKEHSIKWHPLFFNVAEYLGSKETIRVADCCDADAQEALKEGTMAEYVVSCYLQLAKYAEQKEEAAKFLSIYDPLIRLLEKGFYFGFREGGLLIYNGPFCPLNSWYERFLNAKPMDID